MNGQKSRYTVRQEQNTGHIIDIPLEMKLLMFQRCSEVSEDSREQSVFSKQWRTRRRRRRVCSSDHVSRRKIDCLILPRGDWCFGVVRGYQGIWRTSPSFRATSAAKMVKNGDGILFNQRNPNGWQESKVPAEANENSGIHVVGWSTSEKYAHPNFRLIRALLRVRSRT